MSMTLYHVDWCPDCIVVRRKLDDLGLAYDGIIVPDIRSMRKQVHAVSGQYYVPVLKDGDLILTETEDILAYLDSRAGSGDAGSTTQFHSQARTSPDTPSEDDNHPSCRIN
ncbi:MAG TPA: glutathione S-transferase N-terminal domain-containing protein [Nitrospira sp.]|nr:glutathione S-transferase N-terminal domain-containing protein [Nitrospira sp.]